MSYISERKVVVITRKTRADELIRKYNNIAQAAFYLERMGVSFDDYLDEARAFKDAVSLAVGQLENIVRFQMLDRELLPNFIFGPDDVVVAIGPDGLVANTLKYLNGQPLIAINPDPNRYDGVLLPFIPKDLSLVIRDVLGGSSSYKEISMAIARLSDGQNLLAVNDFFVGRRTHVSARYSISIGGREENQSSSGIIVSTGLGSTGWLKSVVAGAREVASVLTGSAITGNLETLTWDSNCLYYSVREPFPSNTTGTTISFGKIADDPLRVVSKMPEEGVIFSDGIEQDYLQFNSGIEAVITLAPQKGLLVV